MKKPSAPTELNSTANYIREQLIAAAKKGEKVYYSDIALEEDDRHMSKLSKILKDISLYELSQNRPFLCAIVISKVSGYPSTGFFELCADLEIKYSVNVLQKECFEYWKVSVAIALTKEERRVREFLIEHAHTARESDPYVFYQKLCNECNLKLNMRDNPHDRTEIGGILGNISAYENQFKRPMISSLVVGTDYEQGDGFYKLCEELFAKKGNWRKQKEQRVDIAMTKECLLFWKDKNNYNKYKNDYE